MTTLYKALAPLSSVAVRDRVGDHQPLLAAEEASDRLAAHARELGPHAAEGVAREERRGVVIAVEPELEQPVVRLLGGPRNRREIAHRHALPDGGAEDVLAHEQVLAEGAEAVGVPGAEVAAAVGEAEGEELRDRPVLAAAEAAADRAEDGGPRDRELHVLGHRDAAD